MSEQLIDFEQASILALRSSPAQPPQFVLGVSGTQPYLNMEVDLVPRVEDPQPEYWGIEVVGHVPGGLGMTAIAPYHTMTPLSGVTGTKGVEVIGANHSRRLDVPPLGPGNLPEISGSIFELRGDDGVRITYWTLSDWGEILDYRDQQRNLRFSNLTISGKDGEIDVLESKIGRMLNVDLNREEANAGADLITLTLLLPPITLNGPAHPFETLAIQTTYLTSSSSGSANAPQQLYKALSLKWSAGHPPQE